MEDSIILKKKIFNMTETRERKEENSNIKHPQPFAKEVTCFIQFFKVFQCASSHAHHIEDKNDSLESKNPVAKTST